MGDGCRGPALCGDRLLEDGREGLRANLGLGRPHKRGEGQHLGCHERPDPGAA